MYSHFAPFALGVPAWRVPSRTGNQPLIFMDFLVLWEQDDNADTVVTQGALNWYKKNKKGQ